MGFVNFPPPITNGSKSGNTLPPLNLPFSGNGKMPPIPLSANLVHSNALNTMPISRHNNISSESNQQSSSNSESEESQSNVRSLKNGVHRNGKKKVEENDNENDQSTQNEEEEDEDDGDNETVNEHDNDHIFPMNVTPSVMIGGPTLASM